ncbi:MAG: di-heme oxidoredictase family protein [Kofleriaceae bacterium]
MAEAIVNRVALLIALIAACGHDPKPAGPDGALGSDAPPAAIPTGHSSSIAVSPDGSAVYVVNADNDSVSSIDPAGLALVREIDLGPTPTVDGAGNYTPAIAPRALALNPAGDHLFVTGQRSGQLYDITLADHTVTAVAVCAEPVGVIAAQDSVYIACTADRAIVKLQGLAVVARTQLDSQPWGLAFGPDGSVIVSAFYGPGATVVDPDTLAVRGQWVVPPVAPRSDPRLAHGAPRGFYDLAARPNTQEMWLVHTLLGIDTAQPALDFERTAFPAISIFSSGTFATTLSTDAQDVAGIDGSIGDVVSGPHAIAFTHDGAFALVVDSNSEDVLAMSSSRVEAALARPLPGHLPEGIAIAPDDSVAYIDERNTGDVAIVRIVRSGTGVTLEPGATVPRFATDPMPAQLRLGQHLFASANSDEYPLTKNHWIACATCHMEGRSDQVTWLFAQGPRDTPSNAGGMLGTGFLFRTADRTSVQDYWHTINVEQGGAFDPVAQATLLDAIEAYVDHAIPLPVPPSTDAAKVALGAQIFASSAVGCSSCHTGARFTDSGAGNPTLDLGGMVVLHAVGTCNAADVAHQDLEGHGRAACMFDTPSLNGVWSSPPYFHDGRAATLHDALELTRGTMGDITNLSADDEAALVEYLRSL